MKINKDYSRVLRAKDAGYKLQINKCSYRKELEGGMVLGMCLFSALFCILIVMFIN